VVTALYRRYRPETFAELIGQSQVTDPLRTALRTDRVNHAYLFSGPRGCGKTTSARILARCLNCAQGPTDTPCGVCPSCVELSRDGSGSLDVVEIDAASHNGVDDARDLRERAIFAPARDRFKIFILDEAHMVTPQGFNALLKIVEEPPEHVKFIFATTEPEKVIGTIRSRTHHYPFRLVPPAQMLEYTQQLCESEGVAVEPGVLPLVVRAGGGSVRDTLSLLDQLIAGSEPATDGGAVSVEYERAVALLGYTHSALLGEVVEALGTRDAAGVFAAIDRVIQTGQDPRRFVEDLLERLRDLIVVAATNDRAGAVLRGIPEEELQRMSQEASLFGTAELSRSADVVNAALTEMTGATSPRLHLELMVARILVPASDDSERGALARVERLERRIGVDVAGAAAPVADRAPSSPAPDRASAVPPRPVSAAPASAPSVSAAPVSAPSVSAPPVSVPSAAPSPAAPAPVAESPAPASAPAAAPAAATASAPAPDEASAVPSGEATPVAHPAEEPMFTSGSDVTTPEPTPEPAPQVGPVSLQHVRDAWPEILEAVEKASRKAWLVAFTANVRDLRDDVLTLAFPSQNDVDEFKKPDPGGESVSEALRSAIVSVLGLRVKYIARVEGPGAATAGAPSTPLASSEPEAPAAAPSAPTATRETQVPADAPRAAARNEAPARFTPTAAPASRPAAPASSGPVTDWAVAAIPQSDPTDVDDDLPPLTDDDAPFDDSAPDSASPVNAAPASAAATNAAPNSAAPNSAPANAGATDGAGWATSGPPVPAADAEPAWAPAPMSDAPAAPDSSAPSAAPRSELKRVAPQPASSGSNRYGEAVVREILNASFIEEQKHVPRVVPRPE
jgi:DNA polymerase-3 subunit gamma/tau